MAATEPHEAINEPTEDTSPELQLCAMLREVIHWDRVAVVVASNVDTRAALRGSDAVLEHFCDLQQTLVQGPSLDAFTYGLTVLVDDLHHVPMPWPLLGASAPADLPVRSLAVLPLPAPAGHSPTSYQEDPLASTQSQLQDAERAEAQPPALGVLIVGRDQYEPFTPAQVSALAHLAGMLSALLVHRAGTGELVSSDVDPSDDLAVVVGMLEERLDTGAGEAMSRIRAYAFASNCTIHDVARAVLAGRARLADLASGT